MSSLAAQSADPVPVPVSSSRQFPEGTNPSAAAAESVRSLYIVQSTEPVIMIGLSPGRQVRGWAS
ncbi:hypothetical protein N7465_000269 [Penicillium sp. CMV-2018d]|nr:hypothetical protein N7465_000269 [Penicillium sp. CMV-2018d]